LNSFSFFRSQGWLFFAAGLVAAGGWLYVQRVLIAHQISYAETHNRPRGNLSDLYPRWLGARELLLHRRNPYGADISREIQAGYYGRPLDASRDSDPKDEQGFALPPPSGCISRLFKKVSSGSLLSSRAPACCSG
jgi:hypothetical protein